MVRRVEDAYILRLDDLPKVVEADGTVYPVVLPLREAARLFHVPPLTMRNWVKQHEIAYLRIGHLIYFEVGVLADFIREHTYTPDEMRRLLTRRRIAAAQRTADEQSALGEIEALESEIASTSTETI